MMIIMNWLSILFYIVSSTISKIQIDITRSLIIMTVYLDYCIHSITTYQVYIRCDLIPFNNISVGLLSIIYMFVIPHFIQ
jgi:hypothetical protein